MQNQPQPQHPYYEDEIDLRELVKTLWRYKWLTLGVTLLAAAAAYITSAYFLPEKYQSAAVVALNRPELAGFASQVSPDELKAAELAALAQSAEVTAGLDGIDAGIELAARAEGENRIRLEVTAPQADLAAGLADEWAGAFAVYLDDQYALDEALDQFEMRLDAARQALDDVEAKIQQAYQQNQTALLEIRLGQARAEWEALLASRQKNQQLSAAAGTLEAQLAAQNPDAPLTWNQSLSLLALGQRAAGGDDLLLASALIPEGYTIAQARQDATLLADSLQEQNQALDEQIEALQDDMLAYRAQLDQAHAEIAAYARERDFALNNYLPLQSQYLEAQFFLESES